MSTSSVDNASSHKIVRKALSFVSKTPSCEVVCEPPFVGKASSCEIVREASVSKASSREVVREASSLVGKVPSGFVHDLLHAVLRTAVSSSVWPSICDRGIEITGISRTANSRLMHILCDKIYPSSHETPLRLFFWYLDPLLLKNDISEVLREIMHRPFLSLKEEFYNRPTWRRIISCLATSPSMFRQASTLLHSWFLMTGLTSVLELNIALVSAVLDMVSRPMAWGVSMEMGLKYPFPHAYFPSNFQELLGLLNGPISCNTFVDLGHHIKLSVICTEASLDPIDDNSTWSMLMKFPTWFYFATVLIFYYEDMQDSFISKVISNEWKLDLNEAFILYLSFVLCPVDKGHRERLAEHLLELSRSWRLASRAISSYEQCSFLGGHNKVPLSWSKKLKISKNGDDKLALAAHKCSFAALASWLIEFNGVCVESWIKPFIRYKPAGSKGEEKASTRPTKLANKIPLGILILYQDILSDSECELLLYYATTGEILQHEEDQMKISNYHEHEIAFCYGSDGRKWAFDGACLVFSLFDIVEEMSVMLFDCEATRLDFICHLKGKVCNYLLRCVEMLLQLCIQQLVEVSGRVGLLDLFRRLIQWKQQGREVFTGCEKFNDLVDGFKKKFLKSKELEEAI
ncbi:uncharacterized protein LOC110115458 isoform X2 [Dendrobium catenatum]|uniref:uncharacterized protein LOC110115458 isoform X2 n=1 Tax=Dendrobium catenatum TaxID=906689 RepID=UPI0009F719C8|nr:uncharacterized protein LOC110115458 isoform X2 [Dendrobium catenatum]